MPRSYLCYAYGDRSFPGSGPSSTFFKQARGVKVLPEYLGLDCFQLKIIYMPNKLPGMVNFASLKYHGSRHILGTQ